MTQPAAHALDAARWAGIVALDGDYGAGRVRAASGPLEAYIEVAARCNLRCQMCPITVDPRYDPHSGNPPLLARETFARLEPMISTLQRAYLVGLGEPFLNRALVEFAERLAQAGVEVWITTNATLVHEEQAEALARVGVARVTVSIDGATAATYERIRRRGRFSDLQRGLRALGAVRRRHGRPLLFLNMVGMAGNLHELPAMIDLCAEVGGDGVHLESLYEWPMLEDFSRRESLALLPPARIEDLLAEARRRAAARGVAFYCRLDEMAAGKAQAQAMPETVGAAGAPDAAGAPEPAGAAGAEGAAGMPEVAGAASAGPVAATTSAVAEPGAQTAGLSLPWACSEPWTTVNVNAAGEVRPCCFNDQPMGNLSERPFADIWNGGDYQQMRADHLAGRVPGSCAQCVRNGRVKRSAFLSPRRPRGEVPFRPAWRTRLLAPAAGELVGSPLVVVGELPSPRMPGQPWLRAGLPELWMDGALLVDLRHYAMIDGGRFAAVIAVPWVTTGAHSLSLGPSPLDAGDAGHEAGHEEGGWDHRRLQVGLLDGEVADPRIYANDEIPPAPATLTAVTRLALALPLRRREPVPDLRIGGVDHPISAWLCGAHGSRWLGVALIDLEQVAPGSHALELRLRHHPSYRRRLQRLAATVIDS